MLPPFYFYWFRIDNKHMTEPWLDQALMESTYKCVARAGYPCLFIWNYCNLNCCLLLQVILMDWCSKDTEGKLEFDISPDTSFSRSKYFHLLIAPIEGFITRNEIDRKIDVTTILFLLVQNWHDWTLMWSGAIGHGIQVWI